MPTKAIATTPANPFPSAELQVAAQLTDQYRKAVSGSREMLIFGAMFMGLGRVLQPQNTVAENGQITGREGGLKGWIENNCPSINYNTAYKFYGLAKKLREGLAIHVNTDVYRLLTAPVHELSKKESKIRLEMDEAIDGKSAYQLEWDLGVRKARTSLPESGGAREGAGRKPKSLTGEQIEIDAFFSDESLGSLGVAVLEKRWHLHLHDEKKQILLAIAELLVRDLGRKA